VAARASRVRVWPAMIFTITKGGADSSAVVGVVSDIAVISVEKL
jgi:hypothetical protein